MGSPAEEALAKAKAERVDFVISDIGLPDGTGTELFERLKGRKNSDRPLRGVGPRGELRGPLRAALD